MINLYISDLELTVDELVYDFARGKVNLTSEQFLTEYDKQRRLIQIYNSFLEKGLEKFDWEIAYRHGFLCKRDWETFNLEFEPVETAHKNKPVGYFYYLGLQ